MIQTSLVDTDHAADRDARHVRQAFEAHLSPAFLNRTMLLVESRQAREPTPSLATCEKVPTSDQADGEPSGDQGKQSDTSVFKDPPETAGELDYITDATEAIRASISRDRDRQRQVLELVQAGEVAHAKRLATCGRRSAQLECGDCGSDENYVPITCGSRLCEDCMKAKMGRVAHQYLPVVKRWDHAAMLRLSLDHRVEATEEEVSRAVDALRGAFGRLLRRKVPHSGDGWEWSPWKTALQARGQRRLAKRWDMERKAGRGIPMREALRTGFYGIDLKQGEDGTVNVHMHVLADVPYLPQAALSSVWDDLTDAPVVDIRRVDTRGKSDEESALMEVVGYAAKSPEFLDESDEVAYFKALKGSKLIQPFGDLHGNTPKAGIPLFCCTCERSPKWWDYLGVVDGRYETATTRPEGGADGDRPPPG